MTSLVPAIGAWVVRKGQDRPVPGVVQAAHASPRGTSLTVQWLSSSEREVIPLEQLQCGLQPVFEWLHVPSSTYERSLGYGVVVSLRQLGGRTQILVDLFATGQRIWFPWQCLRFVKGARFRFRTGDQGGPEAAERFRLRNLAHALALWNENTGALSHFDIDPLDRKS